MADMPHNESIVTKELPQLNSSGELEQLRLMVKDLMDQNSQLKLKLEDVQVERDSFLSALRYYAPDQVFTAEDLVEFQKTAVSSDQILAKMDAILRKAS